MSCNHHHGSLPPCLLPLVTRRSLLKQGAIVAAAAATAAITTGCEFGESFDKIDVDTVEPAPFDVNQADFAALAQIGAIAPLFADREILLVRASEDEILAFDLRCPHSNLRMAGPDVPEIIQGTWDQDSRQLTCRWHTSVYADSGERVSGPTPRGINRYAVTFDPMTGLGEVDLRQPLS